jgi:gliding motility-associated-like protein
MMQPAFAAPAQVQGRSLSLGELTFTGVFPRIFTPNGDGYNDKAVFHFDNPEVLPVGGKIYDITGAQVSELAGGSDPTATLLWDGKDSGGQTVPGGIYFYKIEFQGKFITGTVVVAR